MNVDMQLDQRSERSLRLPALPHPENSASTTPARDRVVRWRPLFHDYCPILSLFALGCLDLVLMFMAMLLLIPAWLLETSARRLNNLSAARGAQWTHLHNLKCRQHGMSVDLLRLFGLLLLALACVWTAYQPYGTPLHMLAVMGLVVLNVICLCDRLHSLFKEKH